MHLSIEDLDWGNVIESASGENFVMEIPSLNAPIQNQISLSTADSISHLVFAPNLRKFLLIQDQITGVIMPVYMNILSNNISNLNPADFNYKAVPANFTGKVIYTNALTSTFISGSIYRSGGITNTLLAPRNGGDCTTINIGYYLEICHFTANGTPLGCDAPILLYVITVSSCTDIGGGGSGGGGIDIPPTQDPGIATSNTKRFIVHHQQSYSENWNAIVPVLLQGRFFINPARNFFTSATDGQFGTDNYSPATGGPRGNTQSLTYCTVTDLGHNAGLTNLKQAFVNGSCYVFYPNTLNSFTASKQTTYNAQFDLIN